MKRTNESVINYSKKIWTQKQTFGRYSLFNSPTKVGTKTIEFSLLEDKKKKKKCRSMPGSLTAVLTYKIQLKSSYRQGLGVLRAKTGNTKTQSTGRM